MNFTFQNITDFNFDFNPEGMKILLLIFSSVLSGVMANTTAVEWAQIIYYLLGAISFLGIIILKWKKIIAELKEIFNCEFCKKLFRKK
jgi:hypothetical protein